MRWIAAVAAIALIVLAFVAGMRVSDTRPGLIAEIITLLAGAAGISLGLYAFFARPEAAMTKSPTPRLQAAKAPRRSARDLALGATGIVLSAILVSGLAVSGGVLWAALGLLLLLPMLAGSTYLCWRFLRANP